MDLQICHLGIMSYPKALAIQERLLQLRQQGVIGDILLLVEHEPVITLGKRGKTEHILVSSAWLAEHNIPVITVNRGGDVTYHGPGQIVGYPIIDLRNHGRSIKHFVHNIEQVFINLLNKYYHIHAFRVPEYPGVWVEQGKITAVGLTIKHWVSMHGFAFNVNTNLDHFKWIIPCGITSRPVCSLQSILGYKLAMDVVYQQVATSFIEVFNYHPVMITQAQLCEYLGRDNDASAQA